MNAWLVSSIVAALRGALRRFWAPRRSTPCCRCSSSASRWPCRRRLGRLDNLLELAWQHASGVQQISLFMDLDAARRMSPRSNRGCAQRGRRGGVSSARGRAETHAGQRRHGRDHRQPAAQPAARRLRRRAGRHRSRKRWKPGATFASWPKVAHVQLDSAWVKRFDAFLRIGKLVVMLLAGCSRRRWSPSPSTPSACRSWPSRRNRGGAPDRRHRRLHPPARSIISAPCRGRSAACSPRLLVIAGCACWTAPVGELAALYGGDFACAGLSAGTSAALPASARARLARRAALGQPVAAEI
jgi:cell division transport system permease protein